MEPFVPHPLPPKNLDYGRLIGLVGRANAELARYDGLLQGVVNPAVLSSKIEGTQATLDEVLEHEAGQSFSPEKDQDIREVVNYRTALLTATAELAHRAFPCPWSRRCTRC